MGEGVDQLVYQLYGLTEEEIKIVEKKPAAKKKSQPNMFAETE